MPTSVKTTPWMSTTTAMYSAQRLRVAAATHENSYPPFPLMWKKEWVRHLWLYKRSTKFQWTRRKGTKDYQQLLHQRETKQLRAPTSLHVKLPYYVPPEMLSCNLNKLWSPGVCFVEATGNYPGVTIWFSPLLLHPPPDDFPASYTHHNVEKQSHLWPLFRLCEHSQSTAAVTRSVPTGRFPPPSLQALRCPCYTTGTTVLLGHSITSPPKNFYRCALVIPKSNKLHYMQQRDRQTYWEIFLAFSEQGSMGTKAPPI